MWIAFGIILILVLWWCTEGSQTLSWKMKKYFDDKQKYENAKNMSIKIDNELNDQEK